jgi:hypothetical protein
MNARSRLVHALAVFAGPFIFASALAASGQIKTSPQATAATIGLGGVVYVHRWSKNGQNEYTPENDRDLARWHDMVTINVHEAVKNGDQLADLANRVLGNYQSHGRSYGPIPGQGLRSIRPSI